MQITQPVTSHCIMSCQSISYIVEPLDLTRLISIFLVGAQKLAMQFLNAIANRRV